MSADTPLPPPNTLRVSFGTALVLLLFTLVFTALMAATYRFTKPAIDAATAQAKMELIGAVLPATEYDNDLLRDAIELPPTPELGTQATSRVYRARRGGAQAALVIEAIAPDGYSGRIDLLIAVRASGELAAVRVTYHRETPGLGDYIEPKKDKNKANPWIRQFDDTGFNRIPREQWRVKKDGGRFEARTGATISARAITNAVGRALQYAIDHRERLFAATTETKP